MKVLIISAFPPDPAPEANHALHISEHLAKAGLAVHVLCKKGSIAATQQNILVHPVISDWSWSDLPRLVKCMKTCRPDVVLLLYLGWVYNHQPMITFLPTISKSVLGVPCVTQFEAIDEGSHLPFFWRALRRAIVLSGLYSFLGTLLRDSARIIFLSSPHKAKVASYSKGVTEKSVILPPPPLIRFCSDLPAIARKRARDSIGASPSDFVLVYWGYIYPGKGVETLLQAFRIVCSRTPNMRLLLVGGTLDFPQKPGRMSCRDYARMIEELPEKLGIGNRVTCAGQFNWESDKGSWYLHAGDACILPLEWGVTLNNSSLAAASTHGLPVICTELPQGHDEALEHGHNVFLVRPRDPEMLADAIQLLSENAKLRERLRAGILDLAQKWHRWDIMAKRLIDVLQSAVSSRSSPAPTKSQTYIAPSGAAARESGHFSNMRYTECDGVKVDNQRLSRLVSSDENIADHASATLVSVVVAVHNVGKYLSQCLDSLVNQTLDNIEIIVVNDASTDNSVDIIDAYKSCYSNIRVADCEYNKGLASARNIGMRVAKSQYIGFIDGDDWADIRMCERMYQRAKTDSSDVVIADAKVFYEDSKTFGSFFDQYTRNALDPLLKTMPIDLSSDYRLLLLEPVAWTKLYNRSFLKKHRLDFEAGMNSYEDICFHFSVLSKAKRISLLDDPLFFYRQNRPGQISARTDRRVFEVFAVFDRIRENLAKWDVCPDIWAILIRVQLRQFDWLLRDRVQTNHKQEFFALVTEHMRMLPKGGVDTFTRQASLVELAKFFCMRRNWFRAYLILNKQWRRIFKRGLRCCLGVPYRGLEYLFRLLGKKFLKLPGIEREEQALHNCFNQFATLKTSTSINEECAVEVFRIEGQKFFFSDRPYNSALGEAVRRLRADYYLLQTAVFREGDIVVDIGAHVGVVSIYLAKKYPFIKVYAIEPDPNNYSCFKRNIALNNVTNVMAINKAITGDGRRTRLYVSPWDSGWATIAEVMAPPHRYLRTMLVESLTLEELFQQYDIHHCRLMKVTALGAVQESLKSFNRGGCVDFLCGEADFRDCSRVQLESASWRIARQHFWRTYARQGNRTIHSWIHHLPNEYEYRCPSFSSTEDTHRERPRRAFVSSTSEIGGSPHVSGIVS